MNSVKLKSWILWEQEKKRKQQIKIQQQIIIIYYVCIVKIKEN